MSDPQQQASSFNNQGPQDREAHERRIQHMARCRRAPLPNPAEAERLVAEFLRQKAATECPPRFAVATSTR